ncbi:Uncharacterised protein [Mycobacterium tuberculosis]|nr:Uncharacterised protein [Mycobacterium tuberculosis]
MCPMMMTITMPIARIRMYEYWLTTLMRFPDDSVSPVPFTIHVSTWKTTRMTTRLPRMPNWRSVEVPPPPNIFVMSLKWKPRFAVVESVVMRLLSGSRRSCCA